MNAIKPSEFYEKYWRIDYLDGKGQVPLPKLSQAEKDFLDNAVQTENTQGVLFFRKRRRQVQVNIEILKEEMKKFSQYFIPANQPTLDKYGQNLEEPTPPPPSPIPVT